MPRKKSTNHGSEQCLRAFALGYPEAIERVACKGTALECSAFKARDKAFLFLGASELKVKLRESLAEAARLAAEDPARYRVGASGWVTVKFCPDQPLPLELLKRWVGDSYRAVAPKQLVARLPERGGPPISRKATGR